MADIPDGAPLAGVPVTNQDGEDLGTVAEVFADPTAGKPSWIAVVKGRLRRRRRLVPLAQSRLDDEALVVPYSEDDLKLAPEHDPEEPLSPDEEQLLVDHYNVGYGTDGTTGPHTGVAEVGHAPDDPHGAVPVGEVYRASPHDRND